MSSYRNLIVWQKSFSVSLKVYRVTAQFPKSEQFGLVSQMRRSSVSIPSNIAVGNYRGSSKEHIQFLRIAFGSGAELETQLEISKELGFLPTKEYENIVSELSEVMKILNTMISNGLSKV